MTRKFQGKSGSAASAGLVLCAASALWFTPLLADTQVTDIAGLGGPRDALDGMIGQMIMVGFRGTTDRSRGTQRVSRMLRNGTIGGVILMQRNMSTHRRLKRMTGALLNAGAPLTPLIAVDQEGGTVQRLRARQGVAYTPSAARMAKRHSSEDAEQVYARMAAQLKQIGINLNFGPVVDLNRNPRNPIIARKRRAYGSTPQTVTRYARAFISAHRTAGVLTAAKHFPGHGSSRADSHHRFVDLTNTWNPVELDPYRDLSGDGGPDMVMVGHLYHPSFSGEGRIPASLSKLAITDELRGRLKFNGIVITDDLEMAAVKARFTLKERAVRAVNAGNDIVLFSDGAVFTADTVDLIRRHIRNAVDAGRIPRQRIEDAFKRIKALKHRLANQKLLQPANPASAVRP